MISLLAAANRPLSQSVTTGTLSMWSGSLFYSLFTSFHFFDDYATNFSLPPLARCKAEPI